MGLFGSSPDGEVDELIENANHSSVTESRLTKLDSTGLSGTQGSKLYDKPLVEYLIDGEQPNYIFYPKKKNIQITHNETDSVFTIEGNAIYCITDKRVLVVVGKEDGDISFSIPLADIHSYECRTAVRKQRISIISDAKHITTEVQPVLEEGGISISDMKETIEEKSVSMDKIKPDVGEEGTNLPEGRCEVDLYILNGFGISSQDIADAERYLKNAVQKGNVISTEGGGSELRYYEKINSYLDEGETPQHILRGKNIEIEYGGSDDYKSGKSVYTAATGNRVLIVIAQRWSGNDTRSIQYESIDGVHFEKGMVNKEIQIRAGGATYEIQTFDQSETKEAMEYIRNQMKSSRQSNQSASSESTTDPTEQLKNLKELHDEGVISDEEFKLKKKDLMDKI